jgi:hypothetical protein
LFFLHQCWAFAVAGVLTTRLCKALVDNNLQMPFRGYRLSPQPLVSCAPNNVCPSQCCSGGHVYSAAKWVEDHELFPESCYEYVAGWSGENRDKCSKEKQDCLEEAKHTSFKKASLWGDRRDPMHAIRVTLKDRKTVGNTVEAMQREIMTHGPITAEIKTPSNLSGYNGKGVFSRGDAPWLLKGELHAYHAWFIHGWDEESWHVTNTWGNLYRKRPKGLRHTLRVKKGTNEMLMESKIKMAFNPAIRTGDGEGDVVGVAEGWPAKGTYTISQLSVGQSLSSDDEDDNNAAAINPKLVAETKRVIAETEAFLASEGVANVADK